MIILLLACIAHKTSLTGIIDHVGNKNCTVELNTGNLIVIESKVCKNLKEGDIIYFYGKGK